MERDIRFTSKSRKHKIGKAHALFVIEHNEAILVPGIEGFEAKLYWSGEDDRGLILEIVAIDLGEEILVIHVMPMSFRRKEKRER